MTDDCDVVLADKVGTVDGWLEGAPGTEGREEGRLGGPEETEG